MRPDHRLPPRRQRDDGFCRYRTESFRDSLRAGVLGEISETSRSKDRDSCAQSDGRGCFGRVSVAPVRPYQGPAELGLSVPSRVRQHEEQRQQSAEQRAPGRAAAHTLRVEAHPLLLEQRLESHLRLGGRVADPVACAEAGFDLDRLAAWVEDHLADQAGLARDGGDQLRVRRARGRLRARAGCASDRRRICGRLEPRIPFLSSNASSDALAPDPGS